MVLAVPGNVAVPGVGQRIIDAAMERFGRVDTVVNNAGIFVPKNFTDYTDEDYDAVTGVNVRGFFEYRAPRSPRCCRARAAVTS